MRKNIQKVVNEDQHATGEIENTVLESIENKVISHIHELTFGLEDCESPIEKLLLIELNSSKKNNRNYTVLFNMFDIFDIHQQEKIKTTSKGLENKEYRVDFLIEAANEYDTGNGYKFVIECDGFEHHSSKEKFQLDRERDRDLLAEGYIIIRFAGSEIVNNANKCVYDIYRIILSHVRLNKTSR